MARITREERDRGFYDERAERMAPAERTALQQGEALRLFGHAAANAPGYARFLAEQGVDPTAVRSIADFARLPVLKKNRMPEWHRADPPCGGFLAVPVASLKRIYISPGPIYDPEGRREDYWGLRKCLYNAGFRAGDIVMNTFSHHLTPAGIFLDEAANGLGCVMVPTGVGNTEIQVRTMVELKVNGYLGTASFLNTLIAKLPELGYDPAKELAVEIALVGGEILTAALRQGLNDHGITVRQGYITAELGTLAYECREQNGMHLADDRYIEICDPGSGEPVPAGEIGEVVVTNIANDDHPLVRYGTGDLSALETAPCPCGRTSLRLKGILGRADEVTKIRGMFVHPRQLDEAVARFGDTLERARIVVTRQGETDVMTVEVCLKPGVAATESLGAALADRIRETTKLRGTVVFVPEIPASSRKIDDLRKWE